MKFVKLEIENRVATVTLNRPEKKNAMNPPLHQEMYDLLTKLAENKDFDVLVLTGAGDSFTAGMDILECFLETYHDPEQFLSVNKFTMGWFQKLHTFPKPTIASVNGWCFGGGMAVLGACDLALASDKAVFGLSEINFGLIPAGGAMWASVYHMLPRQALYYILTGDTISAQEAVTLGLVNKVVEHSALKAATEELASKLSKKNPYALKIAKELFQGLKGMHLSTAIPYEMGKVYELSYFEKGEWVEQGLKQFKRKQYKPGLEAYQREETALPKGD
jgi:trans-feruloyl-CoA hydratase/vanillin synthase